MRARARVWGGMVFVGVAGLLVGCPGLMKKGADGGTDEGGTATTGSSSGGGTTASAPTCPPSDAVNASDVHCYPDATSENGAADTLQAQVATAKTGAGTGSNVATLKKGTSVTRIVDRSAGGVAYTLVEFNDPSDASKKEAGWVLKSAFTPLVYDAGAFVTCGGGTVPILLEGGQHPCVIKCDPNNDKCPAGEVCTGDAPEWTKNGAGDMIAFCQIGNKGGAPTVVDASAPPVPPPPITGCGGNLQPGQDCPASKGYKKMPNGECRLPCQKAADCKSCNGAATKCLGNTWCR
jgi:hypothetical protein